MSLLDKINKAKEKLKNVEVSVTLEDGSEVVEKRASDGTFQVVEPSSSTMDDIPEEESESTNDISASNPNGISNKRRKKVERLKRFGFVVDEKPDLEMAKITEQLYLGSQDVAGDFQLLKGAGITHIVNCACGVKAFYPKNFEYLMIEILDLPESKLSDHFEQVHTFINEAAVKNGKVFIHCNAGISRASSLVISYMMKSRQMTFQQALQHVKTTRPATRPNDGFMRQLQDYETTLMLKETENFQQG